MIIWNDAKVIRNESYRVSHIYLYDKKIEYLDSVLSKWTNFFVDDIGVFKVFINAKIVKNVLDSAIKIGVRKEL
jgi:hypothetical protein